MAPTQTRARERIGELVPTPLHLHPLHEYMYHRYMGFGLLDVVPCSIVGRVRAHVRTSPSPSRSIGLSKSRVQADARWPGIGIVSARSQG